MIPDMKWLEDPTVFRVNRLDAHSDHICYAEAEEISAGKTSLRQSLDGAWRFHWSKKIRTQTKSTWNMEAGTQAGSELPRPSRNADGSSAPRQKVDSDDPAPCPLPHSLTPTRKAGPTPPTPASDRASEFQFQFYLQIMP